MLSYRAWVVGWWRSHGVAVSLETPWFPSLFEVEKFFLTMKKKEGIPQGAHLPANGAAAV
jgi:hypothetical protein